jgi:hypothetical protein
MVFAMVFVGEIYEGSPLNLLPLQHIDLHNLLDGVLVARNLPPPHHLIFLFFAFLLAFLLVGSRWP